MEVLDKLQSNINLIFKLLKGMPGEDVLTESFYFWNA